MDTRTWRRLRPVLEAALERPEDEREAWVRAAFADEPALAERALGLMAAERRDGTFLRDETPLGQRAAREAGLPAAGARLGPWRLERELGRGGMGAVWLAARADDAFEKRVALKLVRTGLDGDEVERRFARERRLLASLEHPGIARLVDAGSDAAGRPYLVMEHVEGRPVDRWCRERNAPLRERVELLVRVCEAVEHAHRRLVVHRDLKPGNVLVTAEGQPKLLDFGIAKLLDADEAGDATLTGLQPYTPHYASPEQVRGEAVGTQTDVYSLGVIAYELLAGRRPYALETRAPAEVLRVVAEVDPGPPSVAARDAEVELPGERARWCRALEGDLDAIVMTALRKEPERRYGSVEALAADLRRYLTGLPVTARPDTLGYRTRKLLRRHGVPLAAAAALLAALLVGLAGTTSQYLRAERARREEAAQNELASRRLVELQRLSEDLAAERTRAVQRAEEVRRFATALIFDVQRALLPVAGATQARELLVRLGLEHLDRLAADAQADDALRVELAGAYVQMGDVLGSAIASNLGRTEEAAEAYRKALELARAVEGPETPRLNGLPLVSEAGNRLSDALLVLGRPAEARTVLEAVLADLRDLTLGSEAALPDLVTAVSTLGRKAQLELGAGHLQAAAALVDEELGLTDELLRRQGDSPAALDTRTSSLMLDARVRRARDDSAGALARLAEANELMQRALALAPGHLVLVRNACGVRDELATELLGAGRADEARWLLEENLERIEALCERDPADLQLRRDRMTCLRNLGRAQLELGDAALALDAFEGARDEARAAVAAEPGNVDLLANLALAQVGLGRALVDLERGDEAAQLLEHAGATVERLVEAAPGDVDRTRVAAYVLLEACGAAARLGRRDASSPALARGREHAARALGLSTQLRANGAATPLDARVEAQLEAAARDLDALADA